MKFAVDCMLGKLAKWLRIFGFDAVFFTRIEDRDLLNLAGKEERVLLTKDTGLLEMADIPSLYIESEDWEHQMIQVLRRFRLKDQVRPYTRCVECNVPLKPLPKEKARNLVSPFVFERASSFSLCPQCGRLFWPGTHHQDMCAKVEALLERV
ncbi:MAG: Mut7-C RNAse domain-containing protein [Candidatus Aminicenantes bacterium]